MLAEWGRLYLLLESYGRIETLPPAVQADLRSQIGWTLTQEEVLTTTAESDVCSDLWWVLGQRTEEEAKNLKVRRTWLQGDASGKQALLLEFAQGHRTFEQVLPKGSGIQAELVFYPSTYPQRAVIKTRQEGISETQTPSGQGSIETAIAAYSQAFTTCPWLDHFPLLLMAMTPIRVDDRWLLQDAQGVVLPLANRLESDANWQLLALSGGHPVTVLGEWDGTELMPLSVWVKDEFYGLSN